MRLDELFSPLSESNRLVVGYHVTDRKNAEKILKQGFLGGWGDVGFGVYFWNSLDKADDYADQGGWEGDLTDPVVIKVTDTRLEPLTDIHPDWDHDVYHAMLWVPMDEDHPDKKWKPTSMKIVGDLHEDGLVIPNVNTTVDVGPDAIQKQAAKFKIKVTKNGVPPLARPDGRNVFEDTVDHHDHFNNQDGSKSLLTNPGTMKWQKMKKNAQPGTDDWFKTWFSRPYLTNGTKND
jgi:hypothetical protein